MKITLNHVRALGRFRRIDPDGADAELRLLLREHRADLTESFGLDDSRLPDPEATGAPELLLGLIERVTAGRLEQRLDGGLERATGLATRTACESMRSLNGVLLPLQHLGELARTPGYEELVFVLGGERHGLARRLLAVVLKELESAELGTVVVTPVPRLRIPYRTPRSRGVFDLRLRPQIPTRECVIVDLDTIPPAPTRPPVYSPANTPFVPSSSPDAFPFFGGAA